MKGRTINFGSAGVGSGSHIAAEYFFKVLAKVPATHVPFQGGVPAINAAVAAMSICFAATAGGVAAQIKRRRAQGPRRRERKAHLGGAAGADLWRGRLFRFFAASWVGFFVPAKATRRWRRRINGAIDAILKEKDVHARLKALGFEPSYGHPAETMAFFKSEIPPVGARWSGRWVCRSNPPPPPPPPRPALPDGLSGPDPRFRYLPASIPTSRGCSCRARSGWKSILRSPKRSTIPAAFSLTPSGSN